MAKSRRRVSNLMISILFGVILLFQGILETARMSHLHGSALFTTPLSIFFFYLL